MAAARTCAIALLLHAGSALASASSQDSESAAAMNPIRKVVTLLQAMQKKVTEEGEKEKVLFDKFMCYCKTGNSDLSLSISAADQKSPALGSEITASEEKLEQSKADLKQAQVDRSAAQEAIAEATSLREKQVTIYAAAKAEMDTNIGAINKAVTALSKGMAGSFLQSAAAQALRKVATAAKIDLLDADRQDIIAFLDQHAGYAPQSGQITGILKTLGEEMSTTLADMTATEEGSIKNFEELVAAKNREIEALGESVETNTARIGELGVSIVQLKEDLSDTQAALLEDQKFLAELSKSCETKGAEWEERSKNRADELVAIADTIKVLNDDDALDLFKQTLPSASSSLVQVRVSSESQCHTALSMIHSLRRSADVHLRTSLDLLALALTGKTSNGFEKVIKMVEEMIGTLKQEQQDDDHKKEYCGTQLDLAEDKKKELERRIANADTAIADAQASLSTLTEEIAALEVGIKALDKSVAEATEQRKEQNAEYKALMASNGAAKELLEFAKNRLNKFYNPALFKAPPKVEGEEDEKPAVFAQVSEHRRLASREAPAPPPETWAAYSSKSSESSGVVAMIDLLIKDVDKEMTEAETEEKNAQEDYNALMSDAGEKRATDAKALTQKSSAKADADSALQRNGDEKTAAVAELMASDKYTQSLHNECDWLMQYFDVRKAARSDEVDALNNAKAVLSGADFALVQTKTHSFLAKRQ